MDVSKSSGDGQSVKALKQALREAQAREALHRQIVDSAIDFAIITFDLDGLVTSWNIGAERILGWTEEEMRGKPARLFFIPEDADEGVPEREMRTARQAGRGADERWHQRKDESRFFASGEIMLLRDADERHVGYLKILRDRTKQRLDAERQRADAEFMRSVLAASDDCIKVLDLDANLTFMSEGGQRVMEVSDFNAIVGCPWPDFWQNEGNAAAKAALETARAGGVGRFQGIADTMKGNTRTWDVQVTAIPGPDGKPEKLLSVSRDVSQTREAQTLLARSQARLNLALGAAGMIGTWEWDLETDLVHADEHFARIYRVDPARAAEGAPLADYTRNFHPDDMPAFEVELARLFDGASDFSSEYRVFQDDGSVRWLLARGKLVRDAAGKPIRFSGAAVDITDRKRTEEQRDELAQEVAHRMKNTLAMVQAIVSQTLRSAPTLPDAAQAIGGRLGALSLAQDILFRTSWEEAEIHDVVEGALRPHRPDDEQIRVSGPSLTLTAQQALGLSLALHELCTNAVKYGAMSTPQGRVDVSWTLSPEGAFAFDWSESGGPSVIPRTRSGFGSRLMERIVPSYFSGESAIGFEATGLHYHLQGAIKPTAG
ncbi:PAS domain S-box protein [Aureimonas sp. AU12]|uniref:PAS domain S-box protein n=1 Tax=Aureimonas sp. AU12 TaxID=1638161 RepID=UPI0007857DCA|nr:PAS domain S-box protein [Aureimonas sp. AU12]